MSVSDLFKLIIRLFGLYIIISMVNSLIQYSWSYVAAGIQAVAIGVGVTSLYIGFILILMFKADTIVRWLKLDRGFESQHIGLEMLNAKTILQLGAILVGGITIISAIPGFMVNLSKLIQALASHQGSGLDPFFNMDSVKHNLILQFLNFIMGILLVTNHDRIAKWLLPKEE